MRKPIIGGNWKMNTNLASATQLADALTGSLHDVGDCDIVIFPPFPYLPAVGERLRGSRITLGAQDVYHEDNGAFTGEISTAMLTDVGVQSVILGHSERRHVIGEDDELINRKLLAALKAGLQAVLCLGETLEQRETGRTEQVVLSQLEAGLEGVDSEQMHRVVLAYEPVWAIGTGRTASPDDAQKVHAALRTAVSSRYDGTIADSIRIQYGGSVKSTNAAALFAQPDIDGGLIGGASLDAGEFGAIVRAGVTG